MAMVVARTSRSLPRECLRNLPATFPLSVDCSPTDPRNYDGRAPPGEDAPLVQFSALVEDEAPAKLPRERRRRPKPRVRESQRAAVAAWAGIAAAAPDVREEAEDSDDTLEVTSTAPPNAVRDDDACASVELLIHKYGVAQPDADVEHDQGDTHGAHSHAKEAEHQPLNVVSWEDGIAWDTSDGDDSSMDDSSARGGEKHVRWSLGGGDTASKPSADDQVESSSVGAAQSSASQSEPATPNAKGSATLGSILAASGSHSASQRIVDASMEDDDIKLTLSRIERIRERAGKDSSGRPLPPWALAAEAEAVIEGDPAVDALTSAVAAMRGLGSWGVELQRLRDQDDSEGDRALVLARAAAAEAHRQARSVPVPLNPSLATGDWVMSIAWDETAPTGVDTSIQWNLTDKYITFEHEMPTRVAPLSLREVRRAQRDMRREIERHRERRGMSRRRGGQAGRRRLPTEVAQHSYPARQLRTVPLMLRHEMPEARALLLHFRPRMRHPRGSKFIIQGPVGQTVCRTTAGGRVIGAFEQDDHLLMSRDDPFVLMEYVMEERPPLLQEHGMGSVILNYWLPPEDDDNAEPPHEDDDDGDLEELTPRDLGDNYKMNEWLAWMTPGQMLTVLSNKLFRAPISRVPPDSGSAFEDLPESARWQHGPRAGEASSGGGGAGAGAAAASSETAGPEPVDVTSRKWRGRGAIGPTTDFLLVLGPRTRDGSPRRAVLREIPTLYSVGQTQPRMKAYAPEGNSKHREFRAPLKAIMETQLVQAYNSRNNSYFTASEMLGLFPLVEAADVEYLLKREPAVARYVKHKQRADQRVRDIPDADRRWERDMSATVDLSAATPENVCQYFGLRIGLAFLQRYGVRTWLGPDTRFERAKDSLTRAHGQLHARLRGISQPTPEEAEAAGAGDEDVALVQKMEAVLQCTPWQLTAAYVDTVMGNVGHLNPESSVGDPTGRGEGFSFVKPPKIVVKKKETRVRKGGGVYGTDLDRRRYTMEQMWDMLIKEGIKPQDIPKQRWARVRFVTEVHNRKVDDFGGDKREAERLFKFARNESVKTTDMKRRWLSVSHAIWEAQVEAIAATPDDASDEDTDDDEATAERKRQDAQYSAESVGAALKHMVRRKHDATMSHLTGAEALEAQEEQMALDNLRAKVAESRGTAKKQTAKRSVGGLEALKHITKASTLKPLTPGLQPVYTATDEPLLPDAFTGGELVDARTKNAAAAGNAGGAGAASGGKQKKRTIVVRYRVVEDSDGKLREVIEFHKYADTLQRARYMQAAKVAGKSRIKVPTARGGGLRGMMALPTYTRRGQRLYAGDVMDPEDIMLNFDQYQPVSHGGAKRRRRRRGSDDEAEFRPQDERDEDDYRSRPKKFGPARPWASGGGAPRQKVDRPKPRPRYPRVIFASEIEKLLAHVKDKHKGSVWFERPVHDMQHMEQHKAWCTKEWLKKFDATVKNPLSLRDMQRKCAMLTVYSKVDEVLRDMELIVRNSEEMNGKYMGSTLDAVRMLLFFCSAVVKAEPRIRSSEAQINPGQTVDAGVALASKMRSQWTAILDEKQAKSDELAAAALATQQAGAVAGTAAPTAARAKPKAAQKARRLKTPEEQAKARKAAALRDKRKRRRNPHLAAPSKRRLRGAAAVSVRQKKMRQHGIAAPSGREIMVEDAAKAELKYRASLRADASQSMSAFVDDSDLPEAVPLVASASDAVAAPLHAGLDGETLLDDLGSIDGAALEGAGDGAGGVGHDDILDFDDGDALLGAGGSGLGAAGGGDGGMSDDGANLLVGGGSDSDGADLLVGGDDGSDDGGALVGAGSGAAGGGMSSSDDEAVGVIDDSD